MSIRMCHPSTQRSFLNDKDQTSNVSNFFPSIFPCNQNSIFLSQLHAYITPHYTCAFRNDKILVKLPHLTQQHHLPNQHGGKKQDKYKNATSFFRCNCNRTCCYTDRFFPCVSNLLSKNLFFTKNKKKQKNTFYRYYTRYCLELFRMTRFRLSMNYFEYLISMMIQ